MRAIKAVVEDGNVILKEPVDVKGPVSAIVVLLDADAWDALLDDPRPRPELIKAGQEALDEFAQGKTTPLDPDNVP